MSEQADRTGISEAEMLGRLMTVETILMVLLAHVANLTPSPAGFAAKVLDNAEQAISKTAEEAPPEKDTAALAALQSFGRLCDEMLIHLHRQIPPRGQA